MFIFLASLLGLALGVLPANADSLCEIEDFGQSVVHLETAATDGAAAEPIPIYPAYGEHRHDPEAAAVRRTVVIDLTSTTRSGQITTTGACIVRLLDSVMAHDVGQVVFKHLRVVNPVLLNYRAGLPALTFEHSTFAEEVLIHDSSFSGKVEFQEVRFGGMLLVEDSTFRDSMTIARSTAPLIEIDGSRFDNYFTVSRNAIGDLRIVKDLFRHRFSILNNSVRYDLEAWGNLHQPMPRGLDPTTGLDRNENRVIGNDIERNLRFAPLAVGADARQLRLRSNVVSGSSVIEVPFLVLQVDERPHVKLLDRGLLDLTNSRFGTDLASRYQTASYFREDLRGHCKKFGALACFRQVTGGAYPLRTPGGHRRCWCQSGWNGSAR